MKRVGFTTEARRTPGFTEEAELRGATSSTHQDPPVRATPRPRWLISGRVLGHRSLAILGVLGACAPEEPDPCAHEPALTYENFGQSFLGRYCNGCHGSTIPDSLRNDAPGHVNLDHYEGVLRWAYEIEEQAAVEEPTMPPGGGTTPLERQLLREWLTCEVFPDYWAYDPEIDL